MKLEKLCGKINYTLIQGNMEADVSDIYYNSAMISAGGMFVCISGSVTDGHRYIDEAIDKGVAVIVLENEAAVKQIPKSVTVIKVASTRYALAFMSAALFNYPAQKLTTIGITGTKGKTTTAHLIKSLLEASGKKVGLIGSMGTLIGDERMPSRNTTPESYELHHSFAKMVAAGCEYLVMEVSSQALKLDRVAGILYDYGIFTNLSTDHIGPNEHESMEEYIMCKGLLFKQCLTGIINTDDMYVNRLLEGHSCEIKTFSLQKQSLIKHSDLMAEDISFIRENRKLGVSFNVKGLIQGHVKIYTPGLFSVYNALGVMLTCHLLGISDETIIQELKKAHVEGRVEIFPSPDEFSIIIDYAHNEVSTRSVLETLLEYKPKRLVCVFGCGGNRSRQRRYSMGEIIGKLADFCIITMDNPRMESMRTINEDIKKGLAKSNGEYIEINDRVEAVTYCLEHALEGDMIVFLGKGHEYYQDINGQKVPFDERQAIADTLEKLQQKKHMAG